MCFSLLHVWCLNLNLPAAEQVLKIQNHFWLVVHVTIEQRKTEEPKIKITSLLQIQQLESFQRGQTEQKDVIKSVSLEGIWCFNCPAWRWGTTEKAPLRLFSIMQSTSVERSLKFKVTTLRSLHQTTEPMIIHHWFHVHFNLTASDKHDPIVCSKVFLWRRPVCSIDQSL